MAPLLKLHLRRSIHTLGVLPQSLDTFGHAVRLHVPTELHGPSVAIRYRCSLVCPLVTLDDLPQRIQGNFVLGCLTLRVVAGRCVFEINVLEVIVEEFANMGRGRLLVESHHLNAVRVEGPVWMSNHLVKHVRCWQLVPRCVSVAVIIWQKIIAFANRGAALRLHKALICLLFKDSESFVADQSVDSPVVDDRPQLPFYLRFLFQGAQRCELDKFDKMRCQLGANQSGGRSAVGMVLVSMKCIIYH